MTVLAILICILPIPLCGILTEGAPTALTALCSLLLYLGQILFYLYVWKHDRRGACLVFRIHALIDLLGYPFVCLLISVFVALELNEWLLFYPAAILLSNFPIGSITLPLSDYAAATRIRILLLVLYVGIIWVSWIWKRYRDSRPKAS